MNPKNFGFPMSGKALLFINGVPPKEIPNLEGYDLMACSDGAFHYLKAMNFPLEKLSFISGDFDSHSGADDFIYSDKFIHTPDQDKTDFHKSLEIILSQNIQDIDVYGGSGGEMDHFLGNLHTALFFKDQMKVTFFDDHSKYFFSPKNLILESVHGKLVSLYPFPEALRVYTAGLNWELKGEDLSVFNKVGTRNIATEEKVSIQFESGELIVFVGK